jgi:hypothetical protein
MVQRAGRLFRRTVVHDERRKHGGEENDYDPIAQEPADSRLVRSAAAHAADHSIVIAMEDGKQVAPFKLNGSACTLKGDVVRCLPASAFK